MSQALRIRWLLWACMAALALAPALGRMHGVLHPHGPALEPPAAHALEHGHAHEDHARSEGLHALFAHHHSAADCQLLDLHTHDAALASTALPLLPPPAPAGAAPWTAQCHAPALRIAFQARAPPV